MRTIALACSILPPNFYALSIGRIVEKTSANIVVKALSGRTSAVAKATEALLCFVELEQGDKVMVSGGVVKQGDKVMVSGGGDPFHHLTKGRLPCNSALHRTPSSARA